MLLRVVVLQESSELGQTLTTALYKHSRFTVVKVCSNYLDLQDVLKSEGGIDVVCWASHLVRHDIAEQLEGAWKKPRLVIYSPLAELAVEAFRLKAGGFWLHPLDPSQLDEWLNSQDLEPEPRTEVPLLNKYLFVKADYKILKLQLDEILFIESVGEYVRFHTTQQKIVALLSMNRLEQALPSDIFFRIHRSYIINIEHIHFIQNNIVSIGNQQLTISKGYKRDLLDLVDKWSV